VLVTDHAPFAQAGTAAVCREGRVEAGDAANARTNGLLVRRLAPDNDQTATSLGTLDRG
jgi:hypothetical protein